MKPVWTDRAIPIDRFQSIGRQKCRGRIYTAANLMSLQISIPKRSAYSATR
jgi:hypothetical protein